MRKEWGEEKVSFSNDYIHARQYSRLRNHRTKIKRRETDLASPQATPELLPLRSEINPDDSRVSRYVVVTISDMRGYSLLLLLECGGGLQRVGDRVRGSGRGSRGGRGEVSGDGGHD